MKIKESKKESTRGTELKKGRWDKREEKGEEVTVKRNISNEKGSNSNRSKTRTNKYGREREWKKGKDR
jgi:hypothetical protein